MNVAVRYYSRGGNTKLLAEAIAKEVGVPAISVDANNSAITDDVDILFIGGALYAYGLDVHLNKYLEDLNGSKIKKAVVFSTSWLSKHSVDLIKRALMKKEIKVEDEYCYFKSKPSEDNLKEAEEFARRMIN